MAKKCCSVSLHLFISAGFNLMGQDMQQLLQLLSEKKLELVIFQRAEYFDVAVTLISHNIKNQQTSEVSNIYCLNMIKSSVIKPWVPSYLCMFQMYHAPNYSSRTGTSVQSTPKVTTLPKDKENFPTLQYNNEPKAGTGLKTPQIPN